MAWQAADVLDARTTATDLSAALAPFQLVAGTTSNPPYGVRSLPPREVAAELARHLAASPAASVALLLGPEDSGLTREQLSRCHLIGVIPSAAAYASLNLAQAALVFLYETRLALLDPPAAGAPEPLPDQERLEAFYRRLEEALDAIDFFQGTARAHMMREMRRIFNRSTLTSRELAIFEGMVHRIVWTAGRDGR